VYFVVSPVLKSTPVSHVSDESSSVVTDGAAPWSSPNACVRRAVRLAALRAVVSAAVASGPSSAAAAISGSIDANMALRSEYLVATPVVWFDVPSCGIRRSARSSSVRSAARVTPKSASGLLPLSLSMKTRFFLKMPKR